MANLNNHDILLLDTYEFIDFREKLERQYGFAILSYTFPPFVSFTSRKSILNTDKGIFFLKEKPEYCSEKSSCQIAAEFQTYLSTRLNNVPEVFKTTEGKYYIEWNGRLFFITEFKPGRFFNGSDRDVISMLDSLKALHDAARDFKTSSKNTESYDLLIPISGIKKYVSNKKDQKFFQSMIELLNLLKEEYNRSERVEYIMSHGDFSIFNVLFHNDAIIAINDFDNAQRLPGIQDLAEFLVSATLANYLAPLTNLKYPVFLVPEANKFSLIVEYYVENFRFTSAEKNLFPILVDLVWLDFLLLAVLKEDYSIEDVYPAMERIREGFLRAKVRHALADSDDHTSFFTGNSQNIVV